MRINHNQAISLEHLVRKVYNCDRFGVVGLADADHLEREPLTAAVAILAPLSFRYSEEELTDVAIFWENYRFDLVHGEYNEAFVDAYISDLRKLVHKFYR